MGQNAIDYTIEQGGKFGLYRKSMDNSSPDEFVVLTGQNTLSSFEKQRKELARDFQRSEEIRHEELARSRGQQEQQMADEDHILFSMQKNERGE